MKTFCIKLSILAFPVLIFLGSIEYYNSTKTTFSIKKRFLENNLPSIKLLVLGSSHNQNAINPEFLTIKTANLAFGGQPISIDYFLLQKVIDRMPDLSTVILEASIHSFYADLDPRSWNGHIYSILYNIDYKVEKKSLKNYLLVYSDYAFFSSSFLDYYNPVGFKYEINKWGFVTNDFHDRFDQLHYDSVEIVKSFYMMHEFSSLSNLTLNREYFRKSVELCSKRGVKVVLITPPFFTTYRAKLPAKAKAEVNQFLKDITVEYGVKYIDYSDDTRFTIYDFKNDNHLNSKGAKKFTEIVNAELFGSH